MKKKFTTVALSYNQHLIPKFSASIVETYCIGYTNNKRDKQLDGYYYNKELKTVDKLYKY